MQDENTLPFIQLDKTKSKIHPLETLNNMSQYFSSEETKFMHNSYDYLIYLTKYYYNIF